VSAFRVQKRLVLKLVMAPVLPYEDATGAGYWANAESLQCVWESQVEPYTHSVYTPSAHCNTRRMLRDQRATTGDRRQALHYSAPAQQAACNRQRTRRQVRHALRCCC